MHPPLPYLARSSRLLNVHPGKYDAFETTLEVLRAMKDHPGADPSKLAGLDAGLRSFLNCGAGETSASAPAGLKVATVSAPTSLSTTSAMEGSEGGDGEESEQQPDEQHGSSRQRQRRPDSAGERSRNANYSSLCSHSWIDERAGSGRPGCYDCLVGSSSTHGLPGGAICCGSRWDLSRCPRAWA